MGKARSDPSERRRVGLLFDERMCKHKQPGGYHPENPERIRAIWDNLKASALLQRCVVLNAKEAEDDHLALVHSKEHIDFIKTISSKNLKAMKKCANKYDSIYFNKGSSEAAYLAAGFVIEATEQVAKGELDSAFAIVRPPGHHAEAAEPMGFCLFNNVAIATSVILNERPELGIKKILIVDWDVHHGNSTQKMFYSDPRVLVFSVHRHDSGRFYPEGNDGSYNMVGEGLGAGYNINVPWENGGVGDADYFAVWDHILIPVAREFDPDMIIISAGFDAAIDDPIGGCCLSSYGYSIMLYKLLEFARGKIVMALEGGYNHVSLAKSTQACIEMLLDYKPSIRSLEDLPLEPTWPLIQAVRQALCIYWPILASKIPDEVINSRSFQIEVDVKKRQHEVEARIPIELGFARVSGGETYSEGYDYSENEIETRVKVELLRKCSRHSSDHSHVSDPVPVSQKIRASSIVPGFSAVTPVGIGSFDSVRDTSDRTFLGRDPARYQALMANRVKALEASAVGSEQRAEVFEKRVVELEAVLETQEALRVATAAKSFKRGLEQGQIEAREAAAEEMKRVKVRLVDAQFRAEVAEKKAGEARERAKALLRNVKKLVKARQLSANMREVTPRVETEIDPHKDLGVIWVFAHYRAYTDAIRVMRKVGQPSDHLEAYFRKYALVNPLHPDISVRFRDLEEQFGVDLSWYPNRTRLLLPEEASPVGSDEDE